MRFTANLIAIGVMAFVAYLFFSAIPSLRDYAPIASFFATLICGVFVLAMWQFWQANEFSFSDLSILIPAWGIASVLFLSSCWLAGVPILEGLSFPYALWKSHQVTIQNWWSHEADYGRNRLFWYAMLLGPGTTLGAIGCIIRHLLLKLFRASN